MPAFDPKAFLAKVGEGTAISKYEKDQIVISQGDVADAVFYIQKGKIKLTVASERGKEAVVGLLGPGAVGVCQFALQQTAGRLLDNLLHGHKHRVCGMVKPRALAVFRLLTRSYLVGVCTGKSAWLLTLEDAIDIVGRGLSLSGQQKDSDRPTRPAR